MANGAVPLQSRFLILVTAEFLQQKAHYPLTKEPENYDFISYYYINVKALVVQKMDSAIHRINHYPAVKYLGNQLRYSLDKDLSIR